MLFFNSATNYLESATYTILVRKYIAIISVQYFLLYYLLVRNTDFKAVIEICSCLVLAESQASEANYLVLHQN